MKILLCTLAHKPNVVINTIRLFGGDKLIIIHGEPDKKTQESIYILKQSIPNSLIPSEFIKVNHYDILNTIKTVKNILKREFSPNTQIFVNISGGRKTLALATQYACYIEFNLIDKLFYLTEENNEVIDLPILPWKLSKSKKNILLLINSGLYNTKKIADKLHISHSTAYKHINELIDTEYLLKSSDIFILTLKAKMMII
ncbi:MAG: CRISPR-associated CARF protein Csa3 [Candidatus Helarchaeota archaeon]